MAAVAQLGDAAAEAVRNAAAPAIEKPRAAAHGDFSCTLSLVLAKPLRRAPLQIAKDIVAQLPPLDYVCDVEVVAPGFINFRIDRNKKAAVVSEVLAAQYNYGRQAAQNQTILLEFVSANPTGPLHVGHGRACAYGDSLANLLEFAGYAVQREYYVNDAGRQTHILAASVWLRYWLETDASRYKNVSMPAGTYQGDYLKPIAQQCADRLQDSAPPKDDLLAALAELSDKNEADAAADALSQAAASAVADFPALAKAVCDIILTDSIQADMQTLGVNTQAINFFSEASLYASQAVESALSQLQTNQHVYEAEGALWFRASAFGDDGDEKDRVIRRSNGDYTYFMADIAYHANKLSRLPESQDQLINVLGADHHGYVPRLQAAVQALGYPASKNEVRLIQFVNLLEGGERVKMSTRQGEFITLRQLIDATTVNAVRYFFISRKNDQHLDFDLAIAKQKHMRNPVYYIEYAYARIHSVFRNWGGDLSALTNPDAQPSIAKLSGEESALPLYNLLMNYPDLIALVARERAPHLLAAFLFDLATQFHNYYETARILPKTKKKGAPPPPAKDAHLYEPIERETQHARLCVLQAVAFVLFNGMQLLGVRLPEKM